MKPRYSKRRCIALPVIPTVFIERPELAAVLDGAPRRVFVLGTPPPARDLVATFPQEPASDIPVRLYLDGHYPVIVRGRTRVTWAGSWFGDGRYDVADAGVVWRTLENELQMAFRWSGSLLQSTPATTGRDLLARTLPSGDGLPVLADSLQKLILSTTGQGRIETMPGSGPVTLHEYDARLAYLSLTRRMPIGEPVELDGPAAVEWLARFPYAPARVYLSHFAAPHGWTGPGILPEHDDALTGGVAWRWPTVGAGWCDSSEYALAVAHGWTVQPARVIGWENTGEPFRVWQRNLLQAMARTMARQTSPTREAMARAAVRAIALHTIGALHGAPHKVTHVGGEPPADANGIRAIGRGVYSWFTMEPARWPEMVHPEWCATIWGRARARLLDAPTPAPGVRAGALHLPADCHVVAFRTDAIYTDGPTGWGDDDDGEPGRYRLKGIHWAGEWPANGTDVLAAKAGE